MKLKGTRGSAKESKSIQHKKLTDFEKKWGKVCEKCGLRKTTISFGTGHNLPKGGGGCQCEE